MKNCKFLITGGTGTLGQEMIKILTSNKIDFVSPPSGECNILDYDTLCKYIKDGIETVVHSAALTDVKKIEIDPTDAYDTNVIGTINVIKACKQFNVKLIFISTDYVFDGKKGNYTPDDPINPLSKYAKTKAAAELLVRTYDNSLVIRTSFFGHDFPYEIAFFDQWSSKDYVDIIAPKIFEEILKEKIGVSHVYSQKRTIYEIAKIKKPYIEKMSYLDFNFNLPRDTSLTNTSRSDNGKFKKNI